MNLQKSLDLQLYLKETSTPVLSCEIFEIFKNTYFEEYLRMTAFVVSFSWLLFIIYAIDL